MMEHSLTDDLALAHALADLAAEVALPYFHRGVTFDAKSDGSPVSDADREVERQMFDLLRRDRPQDSVLGEETGLRGRGSRRWIIDPIDGTFNFVEGDPVWGTHVALEDSGELVLGMITRPVRGQRWWASQGGGAHRTSPDPSGDTVQLHTSTVDELSRSRASLWALPDAHIDRRWRDLAHWTISVEPTLDDILELAEGNREIVVDTLGEVWDQAPAVILVEEAGGRFRDRDGGRRLDRRPGLYTNGHVAPALDAYLYDGPSSSR